MKPGGVGHFSVWAVALVTPPAVFNWLLQPYPAPPLATIPVFTRGRVLPVRFNWVDAAVMAIDSANAGPAISIYRGSCADQMPSTDSIAIDDAGNSGWQYDAATRTWSFGWSTRTLAPGCYRIQLTTSSAAYPAPLTTFPIALDD